MPFLVSAASVNCGTLGEPFGVALGIVATHRNQCEETAAYFTD
jgi:hypothetical protein